MSEMNPLTQWLRETIGPPLKCLHAPLDNFLAGVPLSIAKLVTISLFVGAGIWVFSLRREFVYLGAPDQAKWRDLRVWAGIVLVPYILVYLFLG